jgi:hypothetical protein
MPSISWPRGCRSTRFRSPKARFRRMESTYYSRRVRTPTTCAGLFSWARTRVSGNCDLDSASTLYRKTETRSIFRKNIGRALLHKANDPFLTDWNLDLTSDAARAMHSGRIDYKKQRSLEANVTAHIQSHFRFVVMSVAEKRQRLLWKSRMISTIAGCPVCRPSPAWRGRSSPVSKIQTTGYGK